jgi:hypothetical protein
MPMRSCSLSLRPPSRLVMKNAVVFTDFRWVTFHMDEKPASRTSGISRSTGDNRPSHSVNTIVPARVPGGWSATRKSSDEGSAQLVTRRCMNCLRSRILTKFAKPELLNAASGTTTTTVASPQTRLFVLLETICERDGNCWRRRTCERRFSSSHFIESLPRKNR